MKWQNRLLFGAVGGLLMTSNAFAVARIGAAVDLVPATDNRCRGVANNITCNNVQSATSTKSPVALAPLIGQPAAAKPPLAASGLSIENCQLLRNGAPYRAVGVNYYNAFYRVLHSPADVSYQIGMRQLSQAHIPFMRLQMMPYWPNEMQPYLTDPDALLVKFDAIVHEAEADNIGLIPSVFFNFHALPDAEGEPISAWGDPNSKTRKFAAMFAQKAAARYRNSKAIWGWELSNEIDDWDDLSDGYTYYQVNAANGTPAAYSAADNYTSVQMVDAYKGFADAIRAGDPLRLIDAGYNKPRKNAYHLAHGQTAQDAEAEFQAVISTNNAPGSLSSYHLYPDNITATYGLRFSDRSVTPQEFILAADEASRKACRPMLLGEFGPQELTYYGGDVAQSNTVFQDLLNTFVSSQAPLAAVWVFDYSGSEGQHNITFTNALRDRLTMIINANQQLNGNQ